MCPENRARYTPRAAGKETVARFKAFLAAVGATFENAAVTVHWFHVVQMFTKAVDDVRRTEAKLSTASCPRLLRWAILKRADGRLTNAQADALAELF